MIIRETIEEVVKTEKITDILCNKCADSIMLGDLMTQPKGCYATFDFPYGSIHDGDRDIMHLCDKCYDEFVLTLKIKPEKKEEYIYLAGGYK